ncbi:MAG TPA: hypothetical protein PLN52_14030 [Opitutaceae bacterium]|nr:hypothetical protein [Opitutaceae bacterium]
MNLPYRLHRWFVVFIAGGYLACWTHAQPNSSPATGASAESSESRRERRANMTPDEVRNRMAAALREQFKVENDEEWALISERITKVQELRRANFTGGGLMGRAQGGPPSGDFGSARTRMGVMGPTPPNPEAEALAAAIRNQATQADLKARLDRLREVRKQNDAKLTAAQEELRAILDLRQEAIAVLMGLLP